LAGQRLEFAKDHREIKIRLALLEVLPQRRRLADHVDGLGENDPGLVALRGDTVDFGAAFAVADKHVEADAGQEGRFPVLPADQQDELPAAPVAGLLVNEPKYGLEQRLLPQLQPHRLPDPFALAMAAEPLDELNR